MSGISALVRETLQELLVFPPSEDTMSRGPSGKQEVDPHEIRNLPAP